MHELLAYLYTIFGITLLSIAIYFAIRFLAYKRSFPLPHQFDFLFIVLTILSLFLTSSQIGPLDGLISIKVITWTHFLIYLLTWYLCIFIIDQFLVSYFLITVMKMPVSPPMRRVIVLAIVLFAILIGMQKIFNINPWAVYTPTAALSLGIGYALKDAFQTFFAGLAISQIVRIGDWVQIESVEGEVLTITWARTILQTKDGDHVFVPNVEFHHKIFKNFTYRNKNHRCLIKIRAGYGVPPLKVKETLLTCAEGVPGVLLEPGPDIYLPRYGEYAVDYALVFWIKEYSQWWEISTLVANRIWYAFRRKGIDIPYPIRTLRMSKHDPVYKSEQDMESLWSKIDLFRVLSPEESKFLMERALKQTYLLGEVVVRQNDFGGSFYLVLSGSLEVVRRTKESKRIVMGKLVAGQFFGELSLLTGERRSATVQVVEDSELLRLEKNDFQEILRKRPDLMEKLAEVLVSRQSSINELTLRAETSLPGTSAMEKRKSTVVQKIKDFFNLKGF